MAFYKVSAAVDVRGNPNTIGEVWNKFSDRYMFFSPRSKTTRCQYEQDGTPSVFSFSTDALAMNFARRCREAGLRACVYPTIE